MEDDSGSEREGETGDMKWWEIRGALRAHMAVDMVSLARVCVLCLHHTENDKDYTCTLVNAHASLYFPCMCCIPVCIYCTHVFGFRGLLSLGMGWKTASRTSVE